LESYAREATKDFKGIDNYLFRQHAVRVKTGFVKDLSRLGRDLNKIIILDDLSSNFKWQKDNGIKIKSWMGDMNDNELNSIK
jgi:RNA polymerase II subunit A small phosphatase-like protein